MPLSPKYWEFLFSFLFLFLQEWNGDESGLVAQDCIPRTLAKAELEIQGLPVAIDFKTNQNSKQTKQKKKKGKGEIGSGEVGGGTGFNPQQPVGIWLGK